MRVLVLPDSQNGFRNEEPLHDRMAWEGALTVAANGDWDAVVLLGDMIDLAPFGRFRVSNDLLGTTQRTLDETRWWVERLRLTVGPRTRIVYLEGNHEARFANSLIDCHRELSTLRGLDVPTLLGLRDLGVEYSGPYGKRIEIDGVIYTHGDKYAKWGGATAAKYLQEYPRSVVFGHCHKAELAHRRWVDGTINFAMSPGTLARCDGIVPGHTHPDWMQAVGTVEDGAVAGIIPVGGKVVRIPGAGKVSVALPQRSVCPW